MAWDDDKSTAADPDNPSADEQLSADEWDAHVADQKGHSTRHESGGSDELNVSGLSGDLADEQDPKAHATEHESGGADALSLGNLAGQIASGQITDAAVTAAKIAANAVGVSELQDALGTDSNNKIPGTTYLTDANVEALEAGGLSIDGSYADRSTADSNASVDDVVFIEDEQTLGIKTS